MAHEVKIKGISGKITDLYLDFVGHKYQKEETFIENEDLNDFLGNYLYEAVLEKEPGQACYTIPRYENLSPDKIIQYCILVWTIATHFPIQTLPF